MKEELRELWEEYQKWCYQTEERATIAGFWSWVLTGGHNYL